MIASNKIFMKITGSIKDRSAYCYLTLFDALKMFLGRITWSIEVL